MDELSLSGLEMALVLSMSSWGFIPGHLLGGYIADRFGIRKWSTAWDTVWCLATFLTGFCKSLPQFIAIRFLFGFSQANKARLYAAVPAIANLLNPFDITSVAVRDPAPFEEVLLALCDDPAIGFMDCVYSMPWNEKWQKAPAITVIGTALSRIDKPSAMLNQTFRPLIQKSRDIMTEAGVSAVFAGVEAVAMKIPFGATAGKSRGRTGFINA